MTCEWQACLSFRLKDDHILQIWAECVAEDSLIYEHEELRVGDEFTNSGEDETFLKRGRIVQQRVCPQRLLCPGFKADESLTGVCC